MCKYKKAAKRKKSETKKKKGEIKTNASKGAPKRKKRRKGPQNKSTVWQNFGSNTQFSDVSVSGLIYRNRWLSLFILQDLLFWPLVDKPAMYLKYMLNI